MYPIQVNKHNIISMPKIPDGSDKYNVNGMSMVWHYEKSNYWPIFHQKHIKWRKISL